MASVVNLYDDKLTRLEHVAAVTRDYSVKPLIGRSLCFYLLSVFAACSLFENGLHCSCLQSAWYE
jgi:hypothetical protein